jgi:2-dehydro-3-deoxyphosphogluconate aldolase / (4S)-4-hydroxy-2-oxoglutarate aldolase
VSVLDELARQRVVPVLRCAGAEDAIATARAAAAGGFGLVELTMTTPGVLDAAATLAADGIAFGVGTIRSAGDVAPAVRAGARFVVSFWNPPDFVAAAHEAGIPAIPGGLTPGELGAAQDAGAAALKLFPASAVTPDYLAILRPVLGSVGVIATGGIPVTAKAIRPWLEAGALAVAVGGAVGTAQTVGADEVERRCRALARDLA